MACRGSQVQILSGPPKTAMNTKQIEIFAQKVWQETGVFSYSEKHKKKYYALDMFPYPSGDGLHVGHIKGYFATDIVSNYMRLKGYDVLHPMGWDAFGLPAENYAIKVKKNPREIVKSNILNFKKQMKGLGLSYDWSREINTTDPEYYKWTQWIFLKMYEKGLAYQDNVAINFCPSCKTGLANEEVISGKCERCHTLVQKKKIRQWMLRITKYADRLLEDLKDLNWPEPIKEMQKNWIGRSEGANVVFDVDGQNQSVEVFTTRVDTLFGCTYLVLSPEYKEIEGLITMAKNKKDVLAYIKSAAEKSDIERSDVQREKTGVVLEGVGVINPINNKRIEVWVADYVLSGYGTGAVMAVPAHDQRDFDFATKYNIPIRYVIAPKDSTSKESSTEAFEDYGILKDSGGFSGVTSEKAKEKITKELKKVGKADFTVNYKLRDWVFSRQRYWGEPIPIIHCSRCGVVPVDESDLPVKLPEVKSYEPTGTGESPLAAIDEWVMVKCPKCGGEASRETNTMPQWAGSCWYYLRYIDPKNKKELVGTEKEARSMPVDLYVGGAEHAVLHLLYARFWHKFLYDIKAVKSSEPFAKLRNVGLILASDGQKMSKSRGNVVNPDDLVEKHGADALRMYEMFIGPFERQATWNKSGIVGTSEFIRKTIDAFENRSDAKEDCSEELALLVDSVSRKIGSMEFNTIVSDFMKFSNAVEIDKMNDANWKDYAICLAPIAPHTAEYLWSVVGNSGSVFQSAWPTLSVTESKTAKIVVQLDGKKKFLLTIDKSLGKEAIAKIALEGIDKIAKVEESAIANTVYVEGKIINFVTK